MNTIESTDRCPMRNFDGQSARTVPSDPYATISEFRESDPFWTESDLNYPDGYWTISKFEHIQEVQKDYRTFSHTSLDPGYQANPLMPSMFDPPEQTKQRNIILPLMTPAKIAELEPRMHQVCRELIGSFIGDGYCDAIPQFSRRYPIAVFSELYGLPIDRQEEFRLLAEKFLHAHGKQQEAWVEIQAIMRGEIESRRDHPQGDMLSGISHGTIDGELISFDVAVNLASTVFIGGLDTLPSNIGWTLRYLADHPDQRRDLVDNPGLIPGAVEEFLRIYPAVVRNSRCHATRDIEFHGANIKAGDSVFTYIALANLDGSVFDNPTTVDFGRQSNKHMAFSVGSHRCLGSHLARHELGVAITEWLQAIPDFRISDQDAVVYHGGPVYSLGALPLEWDVGSTDH